MALNSRTGSVLSGSVLSGQPQADQEFRVLITGGAGFVAPYVIEALQARVAGPLSICSTARATEVGASERGLEALDVTDRSSIGAALKDFKPTHVLHLAGIAAPTKADSEPDLAWTVNLQGTRNMALAMMAYAPTAWLIFAGSGLIYGDSALAGHALTEDDLVQPTNDYSATKAAADLALGALAKRGLRVVRCRPFNHTGPGQSEDFVLPSFAGQIARIEAGQQKPILSVGNLDAERDFLDVRDVADAYARCVTQSDTLASGVIFNIASGVPVSVRGLLDELLALARVPISVEIDPQRWRENDMPRFVGDASRARQMLGWAPQHDAKALTRSLLAAARAAIP
jgi:GDP-4-dehydro-6-deoxy-D-mannose reductase